MLLLDTKDKMNIIEKEEYSICEFVIEDSILDLKVSEVKQYISRLIDEIDTKDNVVIRYKFNNPTTEEDMFYMTDPFVHYTIEGMLLEKHEEEVWQPRSSLVDRLNVMLHYQIELINHNTKINNFNIEIYYNNKQIYEMIE